jgi:hypothetical protein
MAESSAPAVTTRMVTLGVAIDVVTSGVNASAVSRAVRDAWHHCVTQHPQTAPDVVVECDHVDDLPALLHWLSQEVTVRAIDMRAGDLLMLHGAALAHPVTGATLAAVAPSGMGKSTWLRTHGTGRRYLSDETVAVDRQLGVVSHAKPVSVVNGTYKRQVPPDELGLVPATGDEQLVGLWLLERDGSVPARIEPISTLDALPLLAQHASHLPVTPDPLHRLADLADGCGGISRARYAEAADLAPFVSAALGDDR